ncbi:alpha/beta hydrolase [Niveibacterium terrae]|uniref:alpha/beta hydrolase n=1 Tax=Niveibacterium terrae TaxID=3373598 RepID=UPI003A90EB85
MLAAQARALLAAAYRAGLPRLHEMGLGEARHSFTKLLLGYQPRSLAPAVTTELKLPRPPRSGGALKARLYRPPDAISALPVVLFFHGGGWTLGSLDGYDSFCRALAEAGSAAVLAVDYRLAPEYPFPAAVDDALFALDWVAAHGADLALDPARIAVAGDSAGGNLAAVAALSARDAGWPALRAQLLIYPVASQNPGGASFADFGDGFLLDADTLAWFQANYLPAGQDRLDWRASPADALFLGNLPSTRIVLAQCDPLHDDGLAFAQALRDAGVDVAVDDVSDTIHGFITMGRIFPQADAVIARAGRALREVLG